MVKREGSKQYSDYIASLYFNILPVDASLKSSARIVKWLMFGLLK